MHFSLDVPPTLVDVQLHADIAIVLQGEEQVVRVLDDNRAMLLNVARVDRSGALPPNMQNGIFHVFGQHEGERLEALDDLMYVLEYPLDRLMLVHDSVQAEAPDGTAP